MTPDRNAARVSSSVVIILPPFGEGERDLTVRIGPSTCTFPPHCVPPAFGLIAWKVVLLNAVYQTSLRCTMIPITLDRTIARLVAVPTRNPLSTPHDTRLGHPSVNCHEHKHETLKPFLIHPTRQIRHERMHIRCQRYDYVNLIGVPRRIPAWLQAIRCIEYRRLEGALDL